MFIDRDNELDNDTLTNLDGFTVIRNRLLDEEVSSEICR